MAYEEEEFTMEGRTLDEIREKLHSKYGRNYRITAKRTDFRPAGLFHLSTKEVQVVKYVVNHLNSYEKDNSSSEMIQGRTSYPNSGYRRMTGMTEMEMMDESRKAILRDKNNILISSQLQKINSTIEELSESVSSMKKGMDVAASDKHETIKKIEELLQQNEFTFSYIQMIEDKIRTEFSLEQLEDYQLVEKQVVDWIGETITITQEKVHRPPRVIIIVGPTGVGKTTTIAKLASNTIIDAKTKHLPRPELCILTIDTMRVGALEQLSKFGEILGKDVKKAETSADVMKIYEDYKDHVDYFFIDTSGYSPNDSTHIGEMKNILNVENLNPEVHLSLSASTKSSDLSNIIRNYEPFGYDSVIITKCDETKQIGNIISVLFDKHKSISYITDGQRVPRNIKKADKIDMLIRLTGFEIDREHIEEKFGVRN